MASQQPWPPYAANRDCSMGFCSIYCPQWCYFYFSTPPPPSHTTTSTLSPILIAIIVMLSSAFFVIIGYLIAFKFCHHPAASSPLASATATTFWTSTPSSGLNDSLINNLTTYRYRHRTGPIADGDVDCSVCLAEFLEGDCLRLLPKCCHAFHQRCIDTWLKSHSNCPLCRASIVVDPQLAETDPAVEPVAAAVARGNSEDDSGLSEETRAGDGDVAIEIVEEEDGVRMAAESSAGRDHEVFVKGASFSELGSSGPSLPL